MGAGHFRWHSTTRRQMIGPAAGKERAGRGQEKRDCGA